MTDPRVEDVFVLFTTDRIDACVAFYARHFGFAVAVRSPTYVQLASPRHAGRSFSIAFMPTDHPFGVVDHRPFEGAGLMLTVQTADATALFRALTADGAPIVHPLTDESWGQRRFVVRDPMGTFVDVVQLLDATVAETA